MTDLAIQKEDAVGAVPARRSRGAPGRRRRSRSSRAPIPERITSRSRRRFRAASGSRRSTRRVRARAARRQPAREERAAVRRRGARRREAEPDPQRQRARRGGSEPPVPVSCVEQGAGRESASRSSRRRTHPIRSCGDGRRDITRERAARSGRLAGRSVGRGTREAPAHARATPRPGQAPTRTGGSRSHLPSSSGLSRSSRGSPEPCSRSGTIALPRLGVAAGRVARLYPKLLRGYLLDALERLDRPAASTVRVERIRGRGHLSAVDTEAVRRSRRRPSARRPGGNRLGARARR